MLLPSMPSYWQAMAIVCKWRCYRCVLIGCDIDQLFTYTESCVCLKLTSVVQTFHPWMRAGLCQRVGTWWDAMGCLMFDYYNILQENMEPGQHYCHDLVPHGFTNWPGQWQVGFSCSGLWLVESCWWWWKSPGSSHTARTVFYKACWECSSAGVSCSEPLRCESSCCESEGHVTSDITVTQAGLWGWRLMGFKCV